MFVGRRFTSRQLGSAQQMFDAGRFLTRERAYLQEVVRHYSPIVLGACRVYAEDEGHWQHLSKEVWRAVVEQATRYAGEPRFEGWLLSVATEVCRDDARRRRGQEAVVERTGDGAASTPRTIDLARLDWTERGEKEVSIREAFLSLAPPEQQALTLTVTAGLTVSQVAEVMGLAPAAASRLIRRGIRNFAGSVETTEHSDEMRDLADVETLVGGLASSLVNLESATDQIVTLLTQASRRAIEIQTDIDALKANT